MNSRYNAGEFAQLMHQSSVHVKRTLREQFNSKLSTPCRHPHSSLRPGFKDVLLQLMEPESIVLAIPDKDLTTHQLAGVLGAPVSAGERMYKDLQWKYFTPDQDKGSV